MVVVIKKLSTLKRHRVNCGSRLYNYQVSTIFSLAFELRIRLFSYSSSQLFQILSSLMVLSLLFFMIYLSWVTFWNLESSAKFQQYTLPLPAIHTNNKMSISRPDEQWVMQIIISFFGKEVKMKNLNLSWGGCNEFTLTVEQYKLSFKTEKHFC